MVHATAFQGTKDAEEQPYYRFLALPDFERLFRVESESALLDRVAREQRQTTALLTGAMLMALKAGKDTPFPKEPVLVWPGTKYRGRAWGIQTIDRVAAYVCYNPLYFEDKNSERYGWDSGIFQPFISTGIFYWDVVKWPYELGLQCPRDCEFNTGYYRPGDPVHYYLYYPQWSWKGAAFETGAVLGLIAVVP